jgi:hypothetical protein
MLLLSPPSGQSAEFEVQHSADGSRVEVISASSSDSLFISRSRARISGNPSLMVMCSEKPSICSISVSALFREANSPDNEQEQITIDLGPNPQGILKKTYSSLILTAAVPSGQSLEAYSLIGITPGDLTALGTHHQAIMRIGSHTDVVLRPASLGLGRLSRSAGARPIQ